MTTPSRRPNHFVHAIAVGVLSIALAMAGVRWFLPWLGHPVFVITGGSMAPAIQMGSLVFVSPVPSAEIAAGDVLTYQRDGRRPTTHRVKSVDREAGEVYVAMKGDEINGSSAFQPDAVTYATYLYRSLPCLNSSRRLIVRLPICIVPDVNVTCKDMLSPYKNETGIRGGTRKRSPCGGNTLSAYPQRT